MKTPNARIKLNVEILHMWNDGEPVYASQWQGAVNKGVDGIRPETYLVEKSGQKQRVGVRFVAFLSDEEMAQEHLELDINSFDQTEGDIAA